MTSVQDRRRLFEEQNAFGNDEVQRSRQEIATFSSSDEVKPSLPPRPVMQSEVAKKPRPPIPPKSKTVSNRLVTTGQQSPDHPEELNLIDLEDGDAGTSELHLLEPQSIDDVRTGRQWTTRELLLPVEKPVQARRTPSPLGDIQAGLLKFRVDAADTLEKANVPRLFRTVSENTQTTFKKVQVEAPKALKGASDGIQKVANDVQGGVKRTVSGIPVPKPFARTGEDLADLTKLSIGQKGICSRCASLPLDKCFSEDGGMAEAYIPWSTPLSRITLHAKWCRLCQLLLSMLCRKEHDPLLLPEVRDYIEPEWLRGVPLHKWASEDYIHQDEYWPFGRSEYRHEGSTQVVGPIADSLLEIAKRSSGVGFRVLTRSAAGRRPQLHSRDFRRTHGQSYREGYQRGKKADSRFPISCVVMITVSAKQADIPGLLWVDLVGCSNAPGAEEKVLSHFMLRAVRNGFAVKVAPDIPLSYGHTLDPHWIDMAVAKLWLAECETRHGTQCSEHGWAVAMRKPQFLRLLDVETLNIVVAEKPQSCRYIALSYVWGGAGVVKLRFSNLKALSAPGGLQQHLSQLPQTILDAMEVVKEIGERYLWVDSLCILQEDTQESHDQIANMDSVYGSAVLTIVAGTGDSADAGLPGVPRRHFVQSGKPGRERWISQQLVGMRNGIEVIAPTTSNQNLEKSIWNTRAWTFQERLLSRRFITFADDQVIWQCRCMIAREDMPVGDTGYEYPPLDWLNLKPAYLGVGTDSHWRDGSLEVTRHGLTHVVRSGTSAEYAKMIAQYSARKITYDSDAVNALAGLLRIFSLCFQAECIYGLPANLLDVALLWRPVEPLTKRAGSTSFPSWSWAAWKGRVAYDSPLKIKRDETGQTMEIEGIRPMLRYFLLDRHTGDLQPLNGTGRGLPLTDDAIPSEWQAHAPNDRCTRGTHCCRTPDLFDLDPRTIQHLSDQNLVFWTNTSNDFRFGELAPQKTDLSWEFGHSLRRLTLLDTDSNQVGNILLDNSSTFRLRPEVHIFILAAEAETQSSLHDGEPTAGDYAYYLVMLVETDARSGISRRLGIGRILKTAWILAHSNVRLICLG